MNTVKPESIALFCLTPGGVRLAKRLAAMLPLTCYTSEALQEEGFIPFNGGFASAAREAFSSFSALIFIGATGIAVRVLAPLVNDKLSDPAVVVIDERARHVISLLSGHAGGQCANPLSRRDARRRPGAHHRHRRQRAGRPRHAGLPAERPDDRFSRGGEKTVNQMLVSGKRVGLWCDGEFTGALSRCDRRGFIPVSNLASLPALDALICVTLRRSLPPLPVPHWKLVPQRVVAGIGCRRDTPALLSTLLDRQLAAQRLDPLALKAIGSVSLKANEPGLPASWLTAAGCRSKPSAPRRCASTSTAFRPRLLSGRRSASAASPAR